MILDAWGWCTGMTQRIDMGRKEGGGFRMGNTCIPVADSFCPLEKGHCYPLRYSCLENPMDRGAWWATVMGSQRVGHDWATKYSTAFPSISCYKFMAKHAWCPVPWQFVALCRNTWRMCFHSFQNLVSIFPFVLACGYMSVTWGKTSSQEILQDGTILLKSLLIQNPFTS